MPKYNCELLMYNIPKGRYSFTPEQIQQVEDNINIVFFWLKRHDLEVAEYFDVVIFGYLAAIRDYGKYRKTPNAKAELPEFIKYHLKEQLYLYFRYANRNERRQEECYSIDDIDSDDDRNYGFMCYDLDPNCNTQKCIEEKLLLEEIFNGDLLTESEKRFCYLLCMGHSNSEIAHIMGLKEVTANAQIRKMRIKLKAFYNPFSEQIDLKAELTPNILSIICPKCGRDNVMRNNQLKYKKIAGRVYQLGCINCNKTMTIPVRVLKDKELIKEHMVNLYADPNYYRDHRDRRA